MQRFFRTAISFCLVFASLLASFQPGAAAPQVTTALNPSDLQVIQQIDPLKIDQDGKGEIQIAVEGDLMAVISSYRTNTILEYPGIYLYLGVFSIYVREGGHWVQKATLPPIRMQGNSLYLSAAISGNTIAFSVPTRLEVDQDQKERIHGTIFLYTWDNGQAILQGTLFAPYWDNKTFANSILLKENTLFASAYNETVNFSQQGSVYIFTRGNDNQWMQSARLTGADPHQGQWFGVSFALSGDGSTAFIRADGIPGGGSKPAVIFIAQRGTENWQDQVISNTLNSSVFSENCYNLGLLTDGDRLAASCPYTMVGDKQSQGVVYLFDRPENGWISLLTPSATLFLEGGRPYDYFGRNGFALKGNTFAAATASKRVYIFSNGPTGWKQQVSFLTPPDPYWTNFGLTAIDSQAIYLTGYNYETIGQTYTCCESTLYVYGSTSIVASPTNLKASEGGGPVSYTLALRQAPTADVTVTVSGPRANPAPASLTFTPANWNRPQTVSLTIPEDQVAQYTQDTPVYHTLSSADPAFNNAAAAGVTLTVTDNDTPGLVLVNPVQPLVIPYNSSGVFQFQLSSKPTADVLVSLIDASGSNP
jgi:hypothetical protein